MKRITLVSFHHAGRKMYRVDMLTSKGNPIVGAMAFYTKGDAERTAQEAKRLHPKAELVMT